MIRSRWRSRYDLDHPAASALACFPHVEVVRAAEEAEPWEAPDLEPRPARAN